MKHFFSIEFRKQNDMLVRIFGVLYRRGVSIISLSYAPEFNTENVRIMAILQCDEQLANQTCKYLEKLVDVKTVTVNNLNY